MLLEAAERNEGVVALLVLAPESAAGLRRVVTDAGGRGEVGGPALAEALDRFGLALLRGEEEPGRKGREAGTRILQVGDEEVRVYVERHLPTPELVVVGAGHLARPVTLLGALLGFRVTVLDDRPDFARPDRFPEADRVLAVDFSDPFRDVAVEPTTHVLLVTRGHRYDYECLRRLLQGPVLPRYVGMIGSRRRVRATFHQLREEGFAAAALERIRAPVGLDLGGETPEEIAVAVAAELVLLRRGGSGRPLVEVEEVARRFFGGSEVEEGAEEPGGADGEGGERAASPDPPDEETP